MSLLYVQCDAEDGGCGEFYPGDMDLCPNCKAATSVVAKHAALNPLVYVYDIETYPNIFTMAIEHLMSGTKWLFEVSDRINQVTELKFFLHKLIAVKAIMGGYNNQNFDWPVVDYIYRSVVSINETNIYDKAMSIITSSRDNYSHQLIKQIDLFKIRHFDNKARSTSLKALEFFMRMKNIKDLPFPTGTHLNHAEKDILIEYNWHDVLATNFFYVRTLKEIEFRETMSEKHDINCTNYNDVKIGKEFFVQKLITAGIQCYKKDIHGKRQACQTHRESVSLTECIPPYIQFERIQFQEILKTFRKTVLVGTNVKALFKKFNTVVDDHQFDFGAGGMHSSAKGVYEADMEWCILDIDGESFYPSIIVFNDIFPEHLSSGFSPIFKELISDRVKAGKKSLIGAALKLAAVGTFGQLADQHSPFYDLKAFLKVTLTGQLMLCMFIEQVIKIEGCKMIQSNTDGITIWVKREHVDFVKEIGEWWKGITGIKMEYAFYRKLVLGDVNNYLAQYEDGSIKSKGRYAYDLDYHKDASSLVIPMAVEYYYIHGQCIDDFIRNHKEKFDFCLRAKVSKTNKMVMRYPDFGVEIPMQKITRYTATKNGGYLFKIAPPRGVPGTFKRANKIPDSLWNTVINEIGPGVWDERIHTKNQSVYPEFEITGICAEQTVTECSDIDNFDWNNIDYEWYIKKAEGLII